MRGYKQGSAAAAAGEAAGAAATGSVIPFMRNVIGGLWGVGTGAVRGSGAALRAMRNEMNLSEPQKAALRDGLGLGTIGGLGYYATRGDAPSGDDASPEARRAAAIRAMRARSQR